MARTDQIIKSIKVINREIEKAERAKLESENRLTNLHAKLESENAALMESQKPKVSEHAINRYLERKYGIDMKKIRKEIMTPSVIDAINAGATSIKVDGIKFPVKNGVIVTAMD